MTLLKKFLVAALALGISGAVFAQSMTPVEETVYRATTSEPIVSYGCPAGPTPTVAPEMSVKKTWFNKCKSTHTEATCKQQGQWCKAQFKAAQKTVTMCHDAGSNGCPNKA